MDQETKSQQERAERLRNIGLLLVVIAFGVGALIPRLGPGALAGLLDLLRIVALLVGLPAFLVGVLRARRAQG